MADGVHPAVAVFRTNSFSCISFGCETLVTCVKGGPLRKRKGQLSHPESMLVPRQPNSLVFARFPGRFRFT